LWQKKEAQKTKRAIIDCGRRKRRKMTFEEIKAYVDELSAEDRQQLREYLDDHIELKAGTMDINKLLEAVDKIREGMSQEEIDEMIALMNEEYIEEVDDSLWED
jgi:uncharacterized protein YeeX (DUF496 family)